MPWLALALSQVPSPATPVDAATGSIVTYILNFGVLGVAAVALAFGWLVPKSTVTRARAEARADLEKENARLIAEKEKAEEQRDEALRVAQTELVPLLSSFTATTGALIPLLQEVVRNQEGGIHGPARRTR